MKRQEFIQRKTQMTAYDKQVVNEMFYSTIEWFEKYIEVTYKNEFPDWENRKQVHNNSIKRVDIYEQPKKAEKTLSSQLHLLAITLEEDASVEFEKELKQEFYKWISATGIDVNDCPERLKHFIFGLNEIFEGNYEKIRNDIANRQREIEMDSPEYMEKLSQLFSVIQAPMRKGNKLEKDLEGKNPDEIEVSRFNRGNLEQGEQAFKGIAKSVTESHENFYFKEQKGQHISPKLDKSLIEKVKQDPNAWSIKEIITFKGYFNGRGEVKKLALVHKDANLKNYDWRDNLKVDPQLIYFAEEHQEEWLQIEQFLSEFQQAWRETVNNIKQSINRWSLGSIVTVYEVCGEDWHEKKKDMVLFVKGIQGRYDDNGHLMTDSESIFFWDKFSSQEKVEIEQALKISNENRQIIEGVKGDVNNWEIKPINGNDWLVHNQAQKKPYVESEIGHLLHPKQRFIDEEWSEIQEVLNNRQSLISQTTLNLLPTNFGNEQNYRMVVIEDNFSTQSQKNSISAVKVLGVFGIVIALLITSVAIVRKRLNNKSRE